MTDYPARIPLYNDNPRVRHYNPATVLTPKSFFRILPSASGKNPNTGTVDRLVASAS